MQPPPWGGGGAAGKSGLRSSPDSNAVVPQSQPEIRLIDIREAPGATAVRAFATVQVGELTLYGCKVVQQAGQAPWVALPDRKAEGERGWFPVVKATPLLRKRIEDVVLAGWVPR
jgi:hypothetical protein